LEHGLVRSDPVAIGVVIAVSVVSVLAVGVIVVGIFFVTIFFVLILIFVCGERKVGRMLDTAKSNKIKKI
jgi:hypothetical protein